MNSTFKMTEPKVDDRPDQHYAGIREAVTMQTLGEAIPRLVDETFGWLAAHGIAPAGPPLVRYYVIDMAGKMDIEIGAVVADAIAGDERVKPCVVPAGRYASLVYTGIENGIAGNGALLDWIDAQGLNLDMWDDPNGDAFGGRVEYMLTGPEDDPDPANWDTEVAMRLRD